MSPQDAARRPPVGEHPVPGDPLPDMSELALTNQPPGPTREFQRAFAMNRGALVASFVFAAVVLGALFASLLAPHDPVQQFRDQMLTPPLWQAGGLASFPLGTDELGRCLLSRLLHGARVSLGIGLLAVLLALVPGVALGLLAAFHARWISPLIMRLMDILLALPGLLLAIAVITILGPGLVNTVIAIAVGALPGYVRLTRASALAEMGREYVIASRVAGAGTLRLMLDTVLPNCLAPLIVNATLGFSSGPASSPPTARVRCSRARRKACCPTRARAAARPGRGSPTRRSPGSPTRSRASR